LQESRNFFCSSLPGDYRFCRVLVNDETESEFILQHKGDVVKKIDAPFWSTADVPPDEFIAYRCDLDKDGIQELILVSHDGVSNGMGVTYSTIYIFPDPIKFPNNAPVSIPVQEFGRRNSIVFDQKLGRYLILATFWEWYSTLDKRRGWGVYLVGKWFSYSHGRLNPLLNRPTLARRFLNSFAKERDNGWFENRAPYHWLQNPKTHRFFREPVQSAKLESSIKATITDVVINSEKGCEINLTTSAGNRTVLCPIANDGRYVGDTYTVRALGIWKNRYLFPERFDPSFSLGPLIGKRVKLESFRDEFDKTYGVLWFLED